MNRFRCVAMLITLAGLATRAAWTAPCRVRVDEGIFEFWPDDGRTFYTVAVPEEPAERNGDLWVMAHGTGSPIHVPQRQDDKAVRAAAWLAERLGYTVASVNYGDHRHQGWAIAAQADLTDAFARFVRDKYALAGKTMVVGTSRGGWVTTECMLRHPETFDGGISTGGVTDIATAARYSRYLFRTELAVMDYSLTGIMMRNLTQGAVALDAPPVDRDTGQQAPLAIEHSSRLHADKLAGKLILALGDSDTRVPPFNLWHMVDALRRTRQSSRFVAVSYPAEGHHSPGGDAEAYTKRLMIELARWVHGRPCGLVPGRVYGPRHWSSETVPDPTDFTEFPSPGQAVDRNMLRLVSQRGTGSYPGGIANAFVMHDLDGDSSAELIYGDAEGYLHIVKLDAGGLRETWRSRSFGVPVFGLEVGDLDDDGKLEIVVGDADARVTVLRAGTPEGTVWEFSDPLEESMYNLHVADIDSDGRTELVFRTGDGYVFSFDGLTHKSKGRSPYLGGSFGACMAVADTDGDDKSEIYVGDHAGYVKRLDGATLEVAETSPYIPIFPWSCITGDFTGNLGSELIVAGTATWGTLDHPHTYMFEGSLAAPRELSTVPTFFTAATVNLDEDLFDEAVLGCVGRVILVDAPSLAATVLFESETDTVITGIAVGDMNGDGRPEVAAASREGNIWVIDPATKRLLGSLDTMAGAYGIAVVETGSGEPEIVVGTRDRHVKWLDGTTLGTVQTVATSWWPHEIRTADFTGDGFLDIVGTTGESFLDGPDGTAFVIDGLSKEVVWRSEKPQGRVWGLGLGDLTGDRVPELVLGPMYTDRSDSPEIVPLSFADTDGDTFQVNVRRRTDRASLWVYDGATRRLLASQEVPGHDLYGILVADLDGDGTTEIAVGDRRGYVRVYRLAGGRLALEWQSEDLGTAIVGIAFGDAADTGHGQLFCGTEDGRVHQIIGRGDTYVLEWTSQDFGSHLWGIAVNDIDNDGRAEIVTANGNGSLFVLDGKTHRLKFRRDGLGTFLGAYNSIVIDDIDRDGHKELILGSSGYIYIFEATS